MTTTTITPPQRGWIRRHPILTGIGGLLVLGALGSALGGGGSSSHTAGASQQAAPSASASAPATAATTPAPKPKPTMTAAQDQAVQSAQGYLTDGQGFSRSGLLGQLTSNYGESFKRADAEFAIRHLHPDWNHQALMSAKGYMGDGQGFSRAGLLDQLASSAGEGFTQAQALYAVNALGL